MGTEEVQALLQKDAALRNAAGGRILEKRSVRLCRRIPTL
ncbi:hypothetical protein QOZ95_003905 [Paenibacillus brasilensis]|uniref:Uncharacterized protein n=1 Tax=Paenibacillus brasilensis TaxID=128574 RepID=A0ABU0L207_9BACL|nr:hypothetical protein [Paenibacillus brasilensis]